MPSSRKARPTRSLPERMRGGLAVGGDADDAALAAEAGGDVEVVVDVEGQALGAAEAAVEDGGVAVAVDGVDDLVGGGGGAGDEEGAGVR